MKKRRDGWYLSKLSHYNRIIPFVMPRRTDSEVFYSERVSIDEAVELIRELNQEQGLELGIMDVIMAAMVRMISQRPKVNRFVVGSNMYARKEIISSLAIKKVMSEHSETTEVKVYYDPFDTLIDVSNKIRQEIKANKGSETANEQDGFTRILNKLPNFIIKFVMWCVVKMDKHGILPKSIEKLSPFHASFFITNLGSLGMDSVYHHLYELGTVSWFVGLGKKHKEVKVDAKGVTQVHRYLDLKFVVDERIVDGYYASKAVKDMRKFIEKPRLLMEPPTEVLIDDEF